MQTQIGRASGAAAFNSPTQFPAQFSLFSRAEPENCFAADSIALAKQPRSTRELINTFDGFIHSRPAEAEKCFRSR
jgi:hypothetical protein